MRLLSRAVLGLLAGCLILAAGCKQRLNEEKTLSLEPGVAKSLQIDAPAGEQKVTVTVASPGAPVSAYLVLEKNRTTAEDALIAGKKPVNPLAGQDRVEQATLEATVPAKEAYAVVVSNAGGKPAQVKVTIQGR
jgi:hypothetical protein